MPASPRRRARCNRHQQFPVSLSHCQRAHSDVSAMVPLQQAAWTRCLSVVMSEAAATHFFSPSLSLCLSLLLSSLFSTSVLLL